MASKNVMRENFEAIVIAILLALFLRAFVIQAYQIPSASMLDTLLIGDRLLVNKFSYGIKIPFTNHLLVEFSDPQAGDIIVFAYPENTSIDYIKRIVGTPGDVIEMRNKVLFRNGNPVKEPYARHTDSHIQQGRDNFGPVTVPTGKYFALGDNRDDSRDSRYWGFLDRGHIRGKAWRIYASWGNAKGDAGSSGYKDIGMRWDRIGKLVE